MGKRFKHDRSGLRYKNYLSCLPSELPEEVKEYVKTIKSRKVHWYEKLWTRFILWLEKLFINRG